ncbi:MAG: AIR synthase-related protein [Cytophagales bacterium]|nr:AIR synthase-related protein [Cytophagales bacterium]
MSAFENNLGKISDLTFEKILFPNCGSERKEVITGPSFGVDTSVIAIGQGQAMAVSSDPLSLIPAIGAEASAWLSVHLIANDMATTGFAPQYAQFVLNLPTDLSPATFRTYWEHLHRFCKDLGVAITGGHTGQIEGQNSTVSGGGTMFLIAPQRDILTSDKAKPGDAIVVTKEAALVATSMLAMCFPETVKNKLGREIQQLANTNFYRTSSLREALLASDILDPGTELTAMHDVTEGGVLGAISEMAKAAGVGFTVDSDLIPVGEAVQAIAGLFEIDPRFSIGAGSMIMAVRENQVSRLINHLGSHSIEAVAVGKFTSRNKGCRIIENGEEKSFAFSGEDPYWESFFRAYNSGLT